MNRRWKRPIQEGSLRRWTPLVLLAILFCPGCASDEKIVSYEARRAHVMNELGIEEHRKGNLQESVFYFQKALRHAEAADDRAEAIRAHVNMGHVFMEQGETGAAAPHFEEALRIARDLDDDGLLFSALEAVGKLRNAQGRYKEAEDLVRKAREKAEDLETEALKALSLNDLGVVLRNQGRMKEAVEAFHYALVLFESQKGIGALEGRASTCMNLASIRFDQGRYSDAWNMLTNSLSCFQQLGDKNGLVTCHLEMARLLEAWGKESDALLRYERAYGTAKEIPDADRMMKSLENILRLSEALGMSGLHDRYSRLYRALRLHFGEEGNPEPQGERNGKEMKSGEKEKTGKAAVPPPPPKKDG